MLTIKFISCLYSNSVSTWCFLVRPPFMFQGPSLLLSCGFLLLWVSQSSLLPTCKWRRKLKDRMWEVLMGQVWKRLISFLYSFHQLLLSTWLHITVKEAEIIWSVCPGRRRNRFGEQVDNSSHTKTQIMSRFCLLPLLLSYMAGSMATDGPWALTITVNNREELTYTLTGFR